MEETDKFNYYLFVPFDVLNSVCLLRDIGITGNFNEKAQQLYNYDEIMSNWIAAIKDIDLMALHTFNKTKVYLWAALRRLNMSTINLDYTDLIYLLQMYFIVHDDHYNQYKYLLSDILSKASNNVLWNYFVLLGQNPAISLFIPKNVLVNHLFYKKPINYSSYNDLITRYTLLKYNKNYNLIKYLYKINREDVLVNICSKPAHPLENLILNIDHYSDQELIKILNMRLPVKIDNTREYILANISKYAHLFLRSDKIVKLTDELLSTFSKDSIYNNIANLTDYEIINYYGMLLPYKSRLDLEVFTSLALDRHINYKRFFIPLYRESKKIINKQTLFFNDVLDKSLTVIAYGNYWSYYIYELDEFISNFRSDDDDDTFQFKFPNNQHELISKEAMEDLLYLLSELENNELAKTLTVIINNNYIKLHERTNADKKFIEYLKNQRLEEQDNVKRFFIELFECGMYMRRWKGPGFPYPIKESETLIDFDPEENVLTKINIINNILDSLDSTTKNFCSHMNLCQYNSKNTIVFTQTMFEHHWAEIQNGQQCIRLASQLLIGTSYRYLRVLFQYTLVNLNVSLLDGIS
jgi:hypothetical protein